MQYLKLFNKIYKDFLQFGNDKKNKLIRFCIENKDAHFLIFGFFLPFLVLSYRLYLNYTKNETLIISFFDLARLNSFFEYFIITIILPYMCFFYISKKDIIFYEEIYKKIKYIFPIYYIFYKIIYLLCKNLFIGCICVICFVLFDLYLISIESNLHFYKLWVVSCFTTFYFFLDNLRKDSYILKKYPAFLLIRDTLKENHYKNNIESLGKFCGIPFILICKMDLDLSTEITTSNLRCNKYILEIEKKVASLENYQIGIEERFQLLKNQKEQLYQSISKKQFFYKTSIYIFSDYYKNFKKICKEIENFSIQR